MRLIQRYSLKLVFALTLLLGLQFPNFVQQYEHRLDAHYIEVERQLQQYQLLAERYFSGDLIALIEKHKKSDDKVFREEAALIEDVMTRFMLLGEKKQRLDASLVKRLYFVASEFNSPLVFETQKNYTAEVVLNRDSITVGLVVSLISTLLLESIFIIFSIIKKRQSHGLKNPDHPSNTTDN